MVQGADMYTDAPTTYARPAGSGIAHGSSEHVRISYTMRRRK